MSDETGHREYSQRLAQAFVDSLNRHVANLYRIPEGAMRVAPGSDALVWKINPEHSGEL